jgi:hypothetical protein
MSFWQPSLVFSEARGGHTRFGKIHRCLVVRAGGEYSNHCYSRHYPVLSYRFLPRNVGGCDKFQLVLSPLFSKSDLPMVSRQVARAVRYFFVTGLQFTGIYAPLPSISFLFLQAVCPRVLEPHYPSSRKFLVLFFSYETSAGSVTIATNRGGQCF